MHRLVVRTLQRAPLRRMSSEAPTAASALLRLSSPREQREHRLKLRADPQVQAAAYFNESKSHGWLKQEEKSLAAEPQTGEGYGMGWNEGCGVTSQRCGTRQRQGR